MFKLIDMDKWPRKAVYETYTTQLPCTYSMSVNIDITHFKGILSDNSYKFFPSILYMLTKQVNTHKCFRMNLNDKGELGYYDKCNPSYTIFHETNEAFTNVWSEYTDDYLNFISNYEQDMLIYQNDSLNSKPVVNNNLFNVSCIPWISFTGFNLNLQKGYDYFPPIFTIGKYYEADGKIILPLAIQVHHAVCDGYHLAKFINELQADLDSFKI